jgi:hypothetical protein
MPYSPGSEVLLPAVHNDGGGEMVETDNLIASWPKAVPEAQSAGISLVIGVLGLCLTVNVL